MTTTHTTLARHRHALYQQQRAADQRRKRIEGAVLAAMFLAFVVGIPAAGLFILGGIK